MQTLHLEEKLKVQYITKKAICDQISSSLGLFGKQHRYWYKKVWFGLLFLSDCGVGKERSGIEIPIMEPTG